MGTPPHIAPDRRDTAGPHAPASPGAAAAAGAPAIDRGELARLCARLGLAMINSGESVAGTHAALTRVAAAYGIDDCSFYTLPTGAIAVLRHDGEITIEMAAEGARTLRLDQVEAVYKLLADAERGHLTPAGGLERLDDIVTSRARYHPWVIVAGNGIATLGFSLILQLPWDVTAVAVALGLLAGFLRLVGARVHRLEIVRPVLVSFVCGCVVFVLAKQGTIDAPYHALIPPLLLSLPFVPLTLSSLELADRQMVSGATRLAYALVQIVFLIFGLLAAQQVTGMSPELAMADVTTYLGWWAPWAGTLLFAVGVALHFVAPLRTLPWLLAVCFAARVGLVLGDAAGSSYLAAMIGAIFMAVVAEWSAASSAGPPRLVTFSPSFILLIPGALALTGLTQIFGPEHALAFGDLSMALFIIVAIAVGLMVGVGLYEGGCRLLGRRAPET
jgi:uncharacterized membrane protein YjjP (DUF1212 family)